MRSNGLRLLLSLGSSRKLFIVVGINAIFSTAFVIGNALLISATIVGIIYRHPTTNRHIALLALLWVLRALFTSQFERWTSVASSTIKSSLRTTVLSSSANVLAIPSGQLTTLLIKGANSLDIYLARFLPQLVTAAFTPVAVISLIALFDLTSAVISILTLPLIPIFGALIGKFTKEAVSEKWQTLGTLSKYFEDSLRGIYTLSIFGRHRTQGKRIQEMGDRYTGETMKVLRISFLSALVLELAATISVALIAVSIGIRLVNSSIEFFPALVVLVLAPEVYLPLRSAASLFHASADGSAALSEILKLAKVNEADIDGVQSRPNSFHINRIETVSWDEWRSPFGAGSIPAQMLSLGDALVIRGGSGLGKTTFLNSILGLNSNTLIRINNLEVGDLERKSLYRRIGWIPQNPSLISGTIKELFTLVSPHISTVEMENLLRRVGLDTALLPQGLETVIGGSGEASGDLSGGQKRRLAIARALAVNPDLFIADEPTADLDPKAASEILELLHSLSRAGAIVIAVLHAPDQRIVGAREIMVVER